MDRLDKVTIGTVVALVLFGAVLLIQHGQQPATDKTRHRQDVVRQYTVSPELENKIKLARNLLAQDSVDKAELLVDSLLGANPFEGRLYMLKGDILMRRQEPVAAMYQYKEAIGLNPDFLDKKTPLFQGKKIKVTVEEAMAAIADGLKERPGDKGLKADRETVYYMKRKLAGSCG